jgi:hypothetical protein
MWAGHSPDDIDEYAWADVQVFMESLPAIWANMNMMEAPDPDD